MIKDIHEFCRLFYNATTIPIGYYSTPGKTIPPITPKEDISDSDGIPTVAQEAKTAHPASHCYFPALLSDSTIFKSLLPNFITFSKNPDYTISPSFSYLGYIELETRDCAVIVGPVFSVPSSDFTLRNFMKEWTVSPEYREEIAQFLANTPAVSFNRFLQILAWLYLCLTDREINISEHFQLNNTDKIHELSSLHSKLVYESKENENYHNTWHFEQKLMQCVQDGSTQKLEDLLQNTSYLSEGTVADNALRQRKNIFITAVALVMRSAVSGGMDMEQAYQLADVYTQDCERSQDVSYVSNLEYTMLTDFTQRVSQTKIPKGMSQEVFDCIQYIRNHINTPIQVNDVAEHIGKSRSYVSGKFKNELGFDISSFIMRCKLEEARSLLASSNRSLSEISTYLCFSSQSYFQNVFKKKYGETPKQYRDRMRQMR